MKVNFNQIMSCSECPKLSDIQNGKVEQTPTTATYTCVSDMFYIPYDENRLWCL